MTVSFHLSPVLPSLFAPLGDYMAKITFIARMTVKPGREQEFLGHCAKLEEHVRAHEKGVLLYEFFKLREPNRYAVLESFAD